MKHLATLLATLCVAIALYAQEPEIWEEDSVHIPYHEMIDSIFQHVDFSYVTTGVLADKAFQPTQIEKYNGTLSDTNKMYIQDFNALYSVMFMGATDTLNRLPEPMSEFINHFDTLTARDVIPIPIIFYNYDKFKTNAIDDSLMYLSGIQLFDNLSRTESPYEQHYLFGAAPAVNISDTTVLQFRFSNDYYYSNTGKTIHSIQADFDDGAGYRNVTMGSTITVNYADNGDKTIKTKITYTDNTVMESHSIIKINAKYLTVAGWEPAYYLQADQSYIGAPASGWVYVKYGCGNTAITKPLIIIEGFDPQQASNFGITQLELLLQSGSIDLIENLNDNGYDIVFLDFNNGADHIQDNAYLVKKLIQDINAKKAANNSTEMNVVLGASMGGLVARWALKDMENNNINHQTSKFISFDSPHLGANVPLGYQKMLRHTANITIGWWGYPLKHYVPALETGEQILNTPAARQMLVYHGYANSIVCPNCLTLQERTIFQSFLNLLGHPNGFPSQPLEKIAVSNGSQTTNGQVFYTNEKLLEINSGNSFYIAMFNALLLANLMTGAHVEMEVHGVPHNPSSEKSIYKGSVWGIVFGIPIVLSNKEAKVNGNILPYDNAPGGMFDLTAAKAAIDNANPIISSAIYFPYPYFCFVPSISSLDIGSEANNLFYNISAGNIVANSKTPFHAYTAPSGLVTSPNLYNEGHVYPLTGTNTNFLFKKLFYSLPGGQNAILSTSISNRIYNFGEGINEWTHDFLRGITINSGGKIHVNVNEGVSFTDLLYNTPTQGSHFDLYVKKNCDGTNAVVQINSGGEMRVGDATVSNTGTVYFNTGTTLSLKAGSKLIVEEGSKIIIKPGASFSWEDGAEIVLAGPNSLIDIQSDDTDIILNSGDVFWLHKGTAQQGGKIRIKDGNFLMYDGSMLNNNHCRVELLEDVVFYWEDGAGLILEEYEAYLDVHYPSTSITLNSTDNFHIQRGNATVGGGVGIRGGTITMNGGSTIQAEGFLVLGKDNTFNYNAGANIFCEFDQSFVQFEGVINVNDAEFTFTGDGSFKFGLPKDWNNYTNIHTTGNNAKITFQGNGPTDIIVSVFDNTWISNIPAPFTIKNGTVQMGKGCWISTAGEVVFQDIIVRKLDPNSLVGHEGIYLNGQDNLIERIDISGGTRGLTCRNFYGQSGVKIKDSHFHDNGTGVKVEDKGFEFINCDFIDNGFGWTANNMTFPSKARNCYVHTVSGLGYGSSFTTSGSASLRLDKCNHINLSNYCAKFAGQNSFTVSCGNYIGWDFGLQAVDFSDLILSPLLANGAGKVNVSDNDISNILLGHFNGNWNNANDGITIYTKARTFFLENGYNKIVRDVEGTTWGLPAYQIFGKIHDCNLNINSNQWESNSPGNISKYSLFGWVGCGCQNNPAGGCFITSLNDNNPKLQPDCSIRVENDTPADLRGFIEYCPDCPSITSENFSIKPLNEAFVMALNTTTEFDTLNGDDARAFDMFYDIVNFGFRYNRGVVKQIQSLAYNRLKNLLATLGEQDPSVFNSTHTKMVKAMQMVDSYITVGREFDDDILEYHSYLDKANFQYLGGDRNTAIETILRIPSCVRLDSSLTAFANQRLCFYNAVEQVLAGGQHVMRFDSLLNYECYINLRSGIGEAAANVDTVIYSVNPVSSPSSITDNSGNIYYATTVTDTTEDFAVIKTLANQNQDWQFLLDGWHQATDSAKVITADGAGYLYVAGKSWNGYEYNLVTAKVNSDGEPVWTAFYNFYGYDATPVGITVDSNFIVSVFTEISNASTSDYALIKYSQCDTSCVARMGNIFENVPLNNSFVETLNFYPNPANDLLTVEYRLNGNNNKFQLMDMTGRVVVSEELNNKEDSKQINIYSLPSGIYSVVIISGDKIQQVNKLAIVR